MNVTVINTGKVQEPETTKSTATGVFRWQKWVDHDGRLWIVVLTYGFDASGRYGANVELLDVDNEKTIDIPRIEFDMWVRTGTLKRVVNPILV
jgi:hypothetical protein